MSFTNLVFMFSFILIIGAACQKDKKDGDAYTVTVTPVDIDDILYNPGMGFESFHRYDGDMPPDEYPPCTVAYFRWYWIDIEPERGNIDFDRVDNVIAQAQEHGQTLAFRIMAADSTTKVPQWLLDLGIAGVWFNDGESFMPDFSDPTFMAEMERVVRAFGERYDGHPAIDHVDIGSVGRWGEWHVSGVDGAEMPPPEIKLQYIDWYLESFPNTPKVMLIGDEDGMIYAIDNGTGWRADCLGDMGGFSDTWNHMDWYPEQIANTGAENAWQTAPVAFEVCWVMEYWLEQGWDVEYILNYALDVHVSVLNAKSSPVPAEWWPAVNDFLKRVGYRFVLLELTHERELSAGALLNLSSRWENAGVAPPYRAYPIAYRLRNSEDLVLFTGESSADLTLWLPGEHSHSDSFTIPNDLAAGVYSLDITILGESGGDPAVRLAIEGRGDDGWYPVSELTVE